MKKIFVVGYPKSGNTWLSRLLGEVYGAPVLAWRQALPLACEGIERKSDTAVHQLHLKPIEPTEPIEIDPIPNAYLWEWRLSLPPQYKIVVIVRDPRDVIVSTFFYWQREEMADAVDAVINGNHPLSIHGSWQSFYRKWTYVVPEPLPQIRFVKYEQLRSDTVEVLNQLTDDTFTYKQLGAAVEAQSIEAKRKQIEKDGDSRPYGKEVQLRNLRKGVVGDWRNHITSQSLAYKIEQMCGEMMRHLNYEQDPDWWKIG